jgi:hypothetical protein
MRSARSESKALPQRPTVHVLHDEKEGAVRQAPKVCGCRDVGVLYPARRDGFPLEASNDLRHRRPERQKHLQSVVLAQVQMLDAVDDAHSPFAENSVDTVAVRNDIAYGERSGSLRCSRLSQVCHGQRKSLPVRRARQNDEPDILSEGRGREDGD